MLEGMARRANISEVSRRHDISSNVCYGCRAKAIARTKQGPRTAPDQDENVQRYENAHLKTPVAEYDLINDCLRDTLARRSLGKKE